tara:strand:+ start:135 stop:563 length:429 start_codon:yes stop_codon:yes gene_type:complete
LLVAVVVVFTVMPLEDIWVDLVKQEPLVVMGFALHLDRLLRVEAMGMGASLPIMVLVAQDTTLLELVVAQCQLIQPTAVLPVVASVVVAATIVAVVATPALVAAILEALLEVLMAVLVVAVDLIILEAIKRIWLVSIPVMAL